jgi:hypothetical protein
LNDVGLESKFWVLGAFAPFTFIIWRIYDYYMFIINCILVFRNSDWF